MHAATSSSAAGARSASEQMQGQGQWGLEARRPDCLAGRDGMPCAARGAALRLRRTFDVPAVLDSRLLVCECGSAMATLDLGHRVLIAGCKATVRYVGPVDGQKGLWVGVEWDDPSRGKHDGSAGGIQYFTCRSGDAAGSFVRIEKVPAGTSLLQALRARYTNQRAEGSDAAACSSGHAGGEDVFVRTAGNRKVLVQLVGEDEVTARQSQIDQLKSARIVSAGVSSTLVGAQGSAASRACCCMQTHPTCPIVHACAPPPPAPRRAAPVARARI